MEIKEVIKVKKKKNNKLEQKNYTTPINNNSDITFMIRDTLPNINTAINSNYLVR